jgi:adenine specific DNA methylase Mod
MRINYIEIHLVLFVILCSYNVLSSKFKTLSDQELIKQELSYQENTLNGNVNIEIEIIAADEKINARLKNINYNSVYNSNSHTVL